MQKISKNTLLWIGLGLNLTGLLTGIVGFSDIKGIALIFGLLTLGNAIALIMENMKALRGRSFAMGLNSGVTTILVLCILGVVNFLASKTDKRFDFTENKINTLSAETKKIMDEIKEPIKMVYFGEAPDQDKARAIVKQYQYLNSKITAEYYDARKNPTLSRQLNVEKNNTLVVQVGGRHPVKTEEITEEKITNSFVRMMRDKPSTVCFIQGHGEKDIEENTPDGLSVVNETMKGESYQSKTINLLPSGNIPPECSMVAVFGPKNAYLEKEVQILDEYLQKGGRALFALDINIKGQELQTGLIALLKKWHIEPQEKLILDPLSQAIGFDPATSFIMDLNRSHPITRPIGSSNRTVIFPLARPVQVLGNAPTTLTLTELGSSTDKSFALSDMSLIRSGKEIKVDANSMNTIRTQIVTAEGSLTKPDSNKEDAEKNEKNKDKEQKTRLVVFGTSLFASNQFVMMMANSDLFCNAISWLAQDDNFIAIRKKDPKAGIINMSQQTAGLIALFCILILPIAAASAGLGVFIRKRRM
jgi:ABC-type uncharacterized transport system involved in gliding motility auxiliary subunit